MAVAITRINIGADKAKTKVNILKADRLPATVMIAHIRLTHHRIVASINTVHPVYGAGNNSASGKLYTQIHRMPPVTILAAVRTIDITGNSMAATLAFAH